jgi:hypothetical protein
MSASAASPTIVLIHYALHWALNPAPSVEEL